MVELFLEDLQTHHNIKDKQNDQILNVTSKPKLKILEENTRGIEMKGF